MNKEEVRWTLQQLFARLAQPMPDLIEPCEEPDFILGATPRRLGIEMTDIYWPQRLGTRPRQEQESLRRRVAKLAEQLYQRLDLPPVYVSVHFARQIGLDKRTVRPLAEHIVELTVSNTPPPAQSFAVDSGRQIRACLPTQVRAMRVHRFDWMRRPSFSVPDGDSVPRLTIAEVQRHIERKNRRYSTYRRKCDAVWLVLSVNGPRLSTAFEVDDDVPAARYDTTFDRVFLLQHMGSSLFQLHRTSRYGA